MEKISAMRQHRQLRAFDQLFERGSIGGRKDLVLIALDDLRRNVDPMQPFLEPRIEEPRLPGELCRAGAIAVVGLGCDHEACQAAQPAPAKSSRASSSGLQMNMSARGTPLTRMPAALAKVRLFSRAVERIAISSAIQPPID